MRPTASDYVSARSSRQCEKRHTSTAALGCGNFARRQTPDMERCRSTGTCSIARQRTHDRSHWRHLWAQRLTRPGNRTRLGLELPRDTGWRPRAVSVAPRDCGAIRPSRRWRGSRPARRRLAVRKWRALPMALSYMCPRMGHVRREPDHTKVRVSRLRSPPRARNCTSTSCEVPFTHAGLNHVRR
jgi:hypothetical protein